MSKGGKEGLGAYDGIVKLVWSIDNVNVWVVEGERADEVWSTDLVEGYSI